MFARLINHQHTRLVGCSLIELRHLFYSHSKQQDSRTAHRPNYIARACSFCASTRTLCKSMWSIYSRNRRVYHVLASPHKSRINIYKHVIIKQSCCTRASVRKNALVFMPQNMRVAPTKNQLILRTCSSTYIWQNRRADNQQILKIQHYALFGLFIWYIAICFDEQICK